MDKKDFSNDNFRPTAFEDRSQYRFQDYEPEVHQQSPAAFQQQQQMPQQNFIARFERAKDEKHLDQLSLGFKIYAGVNAVFSCFPFIHLFLGIMMVSGVMDNGKDAPPAFFGWFFIIFAAVFITIGWTISICNFYAGRFLKERRNYTFCFVMSCINCAFMPLGTVLGILGIIVLVRDSVKPLFQENSKQNQFG